jgi:hypothetical protein
MKVRVMVVTTTYIRLERYLFTGQLVTRTRNGRPGNFLLEWRRRFEEADWREHAITR